jgi:hypothetical protein
VPEDAFEERDQLELAGEVAGELGNAVELGAWGLTRAIVALVRHGKLRHVRHLSPATRRDAAHGPSG